MHELTGIPWLNALIGYAIGIAVILPIGYLINKRR